MKKIFTLLVAFTLMFSNLFAQNPKGPFPPAAGQEGSTAIHMDSPDIVSWVTGITLYRGFMDISTQDSLAYFGVPSNALHKAEGNSMEVVSFGDAGYAILTFDRPIVNGEGFDFAVFENSFSDNFLELAFVEVSTDGERFVRFPSVSLTPTDEQVDGFGSLDPTNIHNLAGKYRQGYGTPFDLEDLADSTGIDINNIRFVKIIDVVGCIQPEYASYDSEGNIVNDPWPTPFYSGGFDLDAVCVINGGTPYNNCNFEDLTLDDNSYWNGSDESGSFTSGGVTYYNNYDPQYHSWSGFAYSNTTDTETPGFLNQYSAITGGGMDAGPEGGTNYGIGFVPLDYISGTYTPIQIELEIEGDKEYIVSGFYVTNTTFAYLSMLYGDDFSKKFGGVTGDDPDWFKLIITGIDYHNNETGTVEFYLADYRFDDNSLDYIIDRWVWVDLVELGRVKKLQFTLESSDVSEFGMNTPAYFAIDNLAYLDGDEVIDNPPVVVNPIEDIILTENEYTIDLNNVFEDPNGDMLSFSVIQNTFPEVIETSIDGSILTLKVIKNLNLDIFIELKAEAHGLFATDSFTVTVSLDIGDYANQFKIYPNPTNGNFAVEVSEPSVVYIYDIVGKLVYKNNLAIGTNNFTLNNLEKGTYIVNVKSGIKTINKKLIIK
ncbi:MAG: DUF4465 domain-containing protein [Bacteroidales bacterium]